MNEAAKCQGAEYTNSDTVTAIHGYQAEWEIAQVKGIKGSQASTLFLVG